MSNRNRTRAQLKAQYKSEARDWVYTKLFQAYPPFIFSAIFYTIISWPGFLSLSQTWLLLPTGLVLFGATLVYLFMYRFIHWSWSLWTTATTIGLCLITTRSRGAVIYILLVSPCVLGMLAPVFLLFAIIIFILLGFLFSGVQYFFYVRLGWPFVICPPRFRNSDNFSESKLCESCRSMLSRSQLLFGSWTILARVEQWLPLHATVGEMKISRQECDLCDAFLSREEPSQSLLNERALGRRSIESLLSGTQRLQRDYGAVHVTPSNLESGSAKVRIWNEKPYSLDRWFDTGSNMPREQCKLELQAPGIQSRVISVSEGSSLIRARSGTYTNSDNTMKIAKNWINACSKHELCQKPSSLGGFVPTRLISVGTVNGHGPHLVETNELDTESLEYLALSHCWGGEVSYKLLQSNHLLMKASISSDALPRNFGDAMTVTRNLGLEYIWIDSLCILQDSVEDWASESAMMGDVFANAVCTIAATASMSSDGGCFRERVEMDNGLTLATSNQRRLFVAERTPTVGRLFQTRVETAPLIKRAWVFQERLLSRRVLHFCTDMVLFECNSLQASEFLLGGSAYEKEPYVISEGRLYPWTRLANTFSTLLKFTQLLPSGATKQLNWKNYIDHSASRGIRGALDVLQSLGAATDLTLGEKLEFNKRWYELVTKYTACALTIKTDKLIAFAGIAALVQKNAKTTYHAGLWGSVALEAALLWTVQTPVAREKTRTYCAPSWSWASVDSSVTFLAEKAFAGVDVGGSDVVFEAEVERVAVMKGGIEVTDPRSLIGSGFLEIYGPVTRVRWSKDTPDVISAVTDSRAAAKYLPDWSTEDESEPGEDELLVLQILTTQPGCIRGLVLREVKPQGPQVEFERLGCFWADKVMLRGGELLGGNWEKRTIRIV